MTSLSRTIAALSMIMLALTGCTRNLSSSTYTQGAVSGKVLQGTIVSARAVTVKAHDRLDQNGMGVLGGGVAGGYLGSQVGGGKGQVGSTVAGALAGAVAGALIEDAMTTGEGMEYLVKIDGKHARKANSKTYKSTKYIGVVNAGDDVKQSIDTDMETDIVSVMQEGDPALHVGSRVYVIYNNDRPRLAPMVADAK